MTHASRVATTTFLFACDFARTRVRFVNCSLTTIDNRGVRIIFRENYLLMPTITYVGIG